MSNRESDRYPSEDFLDHDDQYYNDHDDYDIDPMYWMKCKRNHLGEAMFARRAIPTGQILGLLQGEIIDDPNYSSEYCIDLGDARSLEPDFPFCFVNHSCSPNAEFVSWDEENDSHSDEVWLVTLRAIAPDEEISIDYGWPASSAIRCGCGSPECRGWVVAEDHWEFLD